MGWLGVPGLAPNIGVCRKAALGACSCAGKCPGRESFLPPWPLSLLPPHAFALAFLTVPRLLSLSQHQGLVGQPKSCSSGRTRDPQGCRGVPALPRLGEAGDRARGGHPAMGMPVYPFLLRRPQVWESLGIGTSVSLGDAWGQELPGVGTSMSPEDAWGQEPLSTGMSMSLGDI